MKTIYLLIPLIVGLLLIPNAFAGEGLRGFGYGYPTIEDNQRETYNHNSFHELYLDYYCGEIELKENPMIAGFYFVNENCALIELQQLILEQELRQTELLEKIVVMEESEK